jgi:hypothetical protein
MTQKVQTLAARWEVSEAESLRRIMSLGIFMVDSMNDGFLFSKKDENGKVTELSFPEIM